MSTCNWDPEKHGGLPCPKHSKGGYWDTNVIQRRKKLKQAGYTDKDLEDEDLREEFDTEQEDLGDELLFEEMKKLLKEKYDIELTKELFDELKR